MKFKTYLALLPVLLIQETFAQTRKEIIIPIDSIFVLAEQNSTQLKISQTALETANEVVSVVKTNRLPSVDVGLSALYLGDATLLNRDFTNVQNAPMPHFGNNFSVEASYLVFAGGRISNAIAEAGLEAQVARLAHDRNLADMRFLVAGHYLDLYKLYNQRKVIQKNIEQSEVIIMQVAAKQKEGMALSNDLTRYELMQQNLKLALIEIENNISILNQHLVVTLGLPTETIILPDTTIQHIDLVQQSQAELMQTAEGNRHNLLMSIVNKDIAENEVKLAKVNFYPSVAIVGADQFNGPITIEVPPINKNLNYWYVGIGLKYNLASLYKSPKEVRMAKSRQNMANYARELELEHAQTAIHTELTKYIESFDKLHTYIKSFQLAKENYTVINNRYQNDLVLITEMLDASNMKLNAELQVVNANLNIIYSHFRLLREIGKL